MDARTDQTPPRPTAAPSPSPSPAEDHIRLLQHSLRRLSATPPRLILSPATQPRRAAVALIIHIVPPPGATLPPQDAYVPPNSLDDLFARDWVNQPGCTADLVYIRRRPQVDMASPATGRPPAVLVTQQQQHVAFPGGRMEVGDEGEKYTAMRTTWEELGIDLAEREWLFVGQMDDREITSSLGKRLLMVLSPFVFIRTTPYPFSPIPPDVASDPTDLEASLPPTIYSIPFPYLISPTAPWSHITIDISSRLAPIPRSPGGFFGRVFGSGGKKRGNKRRRGGSGTGSPDAPASPTEGSPEEAAMMTSKGMSFWLWSLRAAMKFFVKTMVGDMRFSAMILKGRVLPYGNEAPKQEDRCSGGDDLKLWGLTLGMTLDLLSGMQSHLYQPPSFVPSYSENILEHSMSSVGLAGIGTQSSTVFSEWSTPGSRHQQLRSRTNSLRNSGSGYSTPMAFGEPCSARQRSLSGSGKFTADGKWVPSASIPELPQMARSRKGFEELKDLEGGNVWTPSMTSVFPRFSIPDVNFWIWVFGKRYRRVVQGWELSMQFGGSNDRRINWSGQALSAFYAAVRKALIVVIVLRIIGLLVAFGLWGWWVWKRWF